MNTNLQSPRSSDIYVFHDLAIVKIRGYKPDLARTKGADGEWHPDAAVDMPGSANWLVAQYGMANLDDLPSPGILWTDYDSPEGDPWRFSCLVVDGEVRDLEKFATEAGYDIVSIGAPAEPSYYGDGSGTVALLQHPDGWVLVQ